MAEPAEGSPLRTAPPVLDGTQQSALFAYLASGKRSVVCDLLSAEGQRVFEDELQNTDILIDDTPVRERGPRNLDQQTLAKRFPGLIHVSVLPFGASGPKADWDGEEVNLLHAGGEGFLLPNGFSHELFPDRPPLKIYGHFSQYQGGATAAFAALSAWWAAPEAGAFALQRLGDGSLEHRSTRRFRYGGVFEALGGFVELLMLEDRQWSAFVELLGRPAWTQDEALRDPLERSRRGDEINHHIREWMSRHPVDDIVRRAQELGVPVAKYRTPAEVIHGDHERSRGLFAPLMLDGGLEAQVLVAPFQFRCTPLQGGGPVPALGERPAVPALDARSPESAE
jgi:benzylsuccinate CoA-transferase BbsE subunit